MVSDHSQHDPTRRTKAGNAESRTGGGVSVLLEIRYVFRSLRRYPGTAVGIVATLAIGIGACVTIYSAGRALVTRAVPFPDPSHLATVVVRDGQGASVRPTFKAFEAWNAGAAGILSLGAYRARSHFVGDDKGAWRVPGVQIAGGFFSVLRANALIGRMFSEGENVAVGSTPVVISEGLWRSRFGGDPTLVGRTLRVDGQSFEVVGVLPRDMQFPAGADVWTPLSESDTRDSNLRVSVIARLETDDAGPRAGEALTAIQRGLDADRPTADRAEAVLVLQMGRPSQAATLALTFLQATVVVLLLITSANAAGLMVVRATRRKLELAIRMSLGAGRVRIVRHLLTESMVLAFASAAVGLGLAWASLLALYRGAPAVMTRNILGWERLGLDESGVGVGLVLALVTGVICGALPALRIVRGDLSAHLREGSNASSEGGRGGRLDRLLLSGEVALSLALMMTAGLLARSLSELLVSRPGFETQGVLAVQWALPPERYDEGDAVARFVRPVLDRLDGVPGVRAASAVSNLPMSRTGWSKEYRILGEDPTVAAQSASWRPMTPGYLEALQIPLLRGRSIGSADGPDAPRVAVVSEALVTQRWSDGADPLGDVLVVDGQEWTVVGIAGDVHGFGVQRPADLTIYVPMAQAPTTSGYFAIRVSGDPGVLAPEVRSSIRRMDPEIAIEDTQTLRSIVEDFYGEERLLALLMTSVALVALLITLVSLSALVAQAVARRRREIGVRIALGARPHEVVAHVASATMMWVSVGIAGGLLMSAVVSVGLARVLFGVGPLDPLVFLLVPIALLVATGVACYVPARSALAVDPVDALKGH